MLTRGPLTIFYFVDILSLQEHLFIISDKIFLYSSTFSAAAKPLRLLLRGANVIRYDLELEVQVLVTLTAMFIKHYEA